MIKKTEKAEDRENRKERIGEVTSESMSKTLVVECQRQFRHARYGKVIRRYKKFYVHDEKGAGKKGDTVRIEETRPYSKLKRWRLVEVVKKADAAKIALSDVI